LREHKDSQARGSDLVKDLPVYKFLIWGTACHFYEVSMNLAANCGKFANICGAATIGTRGMRENSGEAWDLRRRSRRGHLARGLRRVF
jgi:hypothetical protein